MLTNVTTDDNIIISIIFQNGVVPIALLFRRNYYMKKAIALLGCITVCLSLAACKGNDDPAANIKSSIPSPTSSTSSGVLTSISDSSDAATSDSTSSDISSDASSKSTSSKNKTNTGKKNNTSSKSSSKPSSKPSSAPPSMPSSAPSSKPSSSVSDSSNTESQVGITVAEYVKAHKKELCEMFGDESDGTEIYASGNSIVIKYIVTDEDLEILNEFIQKELSREELVLIFTEVINDDESNYRQVLEDAKSEAPSTESVIVKFVAEKGGVYVSKPFK